MMKLLNRKSAFTILLSSGLSIGYAYAYGGDQKHVTFPEASQSYLKQVKKYDVKDVALITENMNKDQIRQILGNPHFDEGLFRVKIWNYVLDVHQNGNDQRCQLRIDFNKKYISEKITWKEQECQQLFSKAQ